MIRNYFNALLAVFLVLSIVHTACSAGEEEEEFEQWRQRYLELRESGVSPEDEPEAWEEVLTGLFQTRNIFPTLSFEEGNSYHIIKRPC